MARFPLFSGIEKRRFRLGNVRDATESEDRKVAVGRSVRETAMKPSSDRVEQKQSEHRDAGRHHDLFGGTQCSVADRDLHEEDTREEQDGQDWRSAVERPGGGLSEYICNI
jgi:hypothetical protein